MRTFYTVFGMSLYTRVPQVSAPRPF